MNIAIIGLGLIGGSILKATKKRTEHLCYGYNRTKTVLEQAKPYLDGYVDQSNMKDMDVVFICLTPCVAVDYVINNANHFKKGSIIVDICGVKEYVVNNLEKLLCEKGINFIGGHPMAGKEVSGFNNSSAELFNEASFIITPTSKSDKHAVEVLEQLILDMGFKRITKALPAEHDRIIAYTSQLAHIASNAYIKSPTLLKHKGFSAGSFQDLTRVARLDSKMWTELFLLNREPLLKELDILIDNLNSYKKALVDLDKEKLQILLEEGNQLKINSLRD